MFKKFTIEENVSSTSQIKNSVQRSIQAQIISQYPLLVPLIEEILPKKQMVLAKCQHHIQLVTVNDEILFFNERDGPFFPTLQLLHKCKWITQPISSSMLQTPSHHSPHPLSPSSFPDPNMMKRMQVDKGAIRFVLSGANIMCPGFTSAGGALPVSIAAEQAVVGMT